MNTLLFFAVFSILTLFYTALGLLVAKNVKTTTDYFLAGRNLGLWPVTMTLIATQLGGGMLLGTSQDAYLYGLYGLLYTLGMALGFLILGLGIAGTLQGLNVATTAELFETKFQSPALKQFASLLSVATLGGILLAQVVGSRAIIQNLDMGIGNEIVFIGFWMFVILYTMVGGLHAVVMADVFQVIMIVITFVGIFLYSIFYGPSFHWSAIATVQKESFGYLPISTNSLLATLCMPALFSLIEQDLAQRFFAARSKKVALWSALIAGTFMILFALIPIYFGMQAKLLALPIEAGKSPLIPVIEFLTNEFVVIFALCAIMAAITSTADSLLCAISSNLAQDFDFGWLGNHTALYRSQLITCVIGILALAGSYLVPQNIISILIGSYELSVSCLLVPLLFAYFSNNISRQAALYAVSAGFIGFCGIQFWHTDLPKAFLPLILSGIGYGIGLIKR
jgi:Na+/proline symporter